MSAAILRGSSCGSSSFLLLLLLLLLLLAANIKAPSCSTNCLPNSRCCTAVALSADGGKSYRLGNLLLLLLLLLLLQLLPASFCCC